MSDIPQNWTVDGWQKVKACIDYSDHMYRPDFVYWLQNNHSVWVAFVNQTKIAFEMQDRHRFSARAIMEIVRWNTAVREKSPIFKVNNNYVADLARLVMDLHQPLAGFFQIRNNPTRDRGMHKI